MENRASVDAPAREFARGGAKGNRAGHLNGCPINRFPIAKKEAQRREPTGLLAPGGADAGKAGPRWSQNTDRSTAFPHGPATWLISQSRFGHASPPRIVSVARRWCALGCCHGGLIGHARSPRSRRRALAWSRSSRVSGCSTPIASNCLCGGGWYGRGRWF